MPITSRLLIRSSVFTHAKLQSRLMDFHEIWLQNLGTLIEQFTFLSNSGKFKRALKGTACFRYDSVMYVGLPIIPIESQNPTSCLQSVLVRFVWISKQTVNIFL
jgi:hypothetical protein